MRNPLLLLAALLFGFSFNLQFHPESQVLPASISVTSEHFQPDSLAFQDGDENYGERLNAGYGDLIIALYSVKDDKGNSLIQGYCINKHGHGLFRLAVTQEDIDRTLAIPLRGKNPRPRNRLVKRARGCKAAFYILTSGQFQVNIGPDVEGKAWTIVFDTLEAKNIERRAYNIYGD